MNNDTITDAHHHFANGLIQLHKTAGIDYRCAIGHLEEAKGTTDDFLLFQVYGALAEAYGRSHDDNKSLCSAEEQLKLARRLPVLEEKAKNNIFIHLALRNFNSVLVELQGICDHQSFTGNCYLFSNFIYHLGTLAATPSLGTKNKTIFEGGIKLLENLPQKFFNNIFIFSFPWNSKIVINY